MAMIESRARATSDPEARREVLASGEFTVADAQVPRGPIRVSPDNPRLLAYSDGTPKYKLGRSRSIVSSVFFAVGRTSSSTLVAPAHSGNVIALPRP